MRIVIDFMRTDAFNSMLPACPILIIALEFRRVPRTKVHLCQSAQDYNPGNSHVPTQQNPIFVRRKVALLVQTASDWSRQVLRGVAKYAYQHGTWDFYVEPRGFYEQLRLPRGWRGDGVIARLGDPALYRSLRRRNMPVVNVSWLGKRYRDVPQVLSDEAACGTLAEKGFEQLGYVGPSAELGYEDELGKHFVRTAVDAECDCRVFSPPALDATTDVRIRRARILAWLQQLKKPAGVLVWSSDVGRNVTTASTSVGYRVPEDVAVLCAEHDSLMSSLAPIPLSNLDQAPMRVGYAAAAVLDELMQGQLAPEAPTWVPPIGVVQRQSTDTYAVDDPSVASALRFIRDNAHRPINVGDLLRAEGVSRRFLEQRFKRQLGRTPAAEIRDVRLQRAKRLLVETDFPIPVVAEMTGFQHPEVLIRNFRVAVGTSPGRFRKER